jgi:hypothetical protein
MGAGTTGTFKFDCESKEFNSTGKWFTNIKCYAVNEA